MPFWRRRPEEAPIEEPSTAAPSAPERAVEPGPTTAPAAPIAPEPSADAARVIPDFDPTAFLAVTPAHTLDQGLERTRTGFMTQLRGLLGGDEPQWDEVEETLIAEEVIPSDNWEWAEIDGGRLVWAAQGMLHAGQLGPKGLSGEKVLYDFNPMQFERIEAPY